MDDMLPASMGDREGDNNDLEVIMTMVRYALVISLALLSACADDADDGPVAPPEDAASDVGAADTSVNPEDTTTPPEDTATPPEDTATPPEDTVTPPEDTVTPPEDTATPPEDTTTPPEDTATPPEDTTPPANPCEPNPCQNNGNCKVSAEGEVECYCVEPFTGEFCETCEASCGAMECGDDGCGGSCGTCDPGWSCNAEGMCEEPENPKQALCIETGGTWDPTSCGDWTCGVEPLCKALKPGCNCGEGKSFDAEAGCFEDDSCGGDACNPNPCDVGKNCKLLPDGTHECFVDVPDWCAAVCAGQLAGCPDAVKGDAQSCEAQCADNFLKKCQPKHMDFANCFPGDGAWVCDAVLGLAPANDLCAAEWAAVADCEANEAQANICPDGMQKLGEFAIWCGKVNVHMSPMTGMWSKDEDCSSGCNDKDINYCQKYWPGAEEVVEISISPVDKPFFNAGCQVEYPHPGKSQFACCGSPMEP